jgi:hypothetical protein
MARKKTLGEDERYFEASMTGWLIVTRNNQPLLYDGRVPMFWSRSVAKLNLVDWMKQGGCRVVRASLRVAR